MHLDSGLLEMVGQTVADKIPHSTGWRTAVPSVLGHPSHPSHSPIDCKFLKERTWEREKRPWQRERNQETVCVCDLWDHFLFYLFMGFPDGSDGKESTCNAGDLVSIPGLGRSPGEGKDYPPTPVLWPGKFHGLYSPWGCKESDTTSLSLFQRFFYFCMWPKID